ncbi:MAG: RNA 3'-terminal phosphate cyclase [Candidatus Caldarchaeum sp.]
MERFLELDGSIGEGGGQVLRVALAISAIIRRPLHVYNIRKKRSNPGLRNQHLTAVRAVQLACGGEVKNAHVGSTEIFFIPGRDTIDNLFLDTGTAGSTSLVLQSLIPVLCFGKTRTLFRIRGGTNNPNAPTFEYFQQIFFHFLHRIGVECGLRLLRRGFYPRGGGEVEGYIVPVKRISAFSLTERPQLTKVSIHAYTSRLPPHVAKRMAESCRKRLQADGITVVETREEVLTESMHSCAIDPGAGIFVAGEFDTIRMGVDRLGEKGVPAEKVGQEAAEDFLKEYRSGAPVDTHLGDMLVIYAALAEGVSTYRVSTLTMHTLTSIDVCKALLEITASVDGELGGPATITIRGTGILNKNIS